MTHEDTDIPPAQCNLSGSRLPRQTESANPPSPYYSLIYLIILPIYISIFYPPPILTTSNCNMYSSSIWRKSVVRATSHLLVARSDTSSCRFPLSLSLLCESNRLPPSDTLIRRHKLADQTTCRKNEIGLAAAGSLWPQKTISRCLKTFGY
jgi:hypothetical protein